MLRQRLVGLRARFAGVVLLATLAGVFTTQHAAAYCRTTSCRPAEDDCDVDANGCITSGIPLRWPLGCVTFAIDRNGAPRQGISYDTAQQVTSDSFRSWVNATCTRGEHPSLGAVSLGWLACDKPEYNDDPPLPNANAIVFREDDWPYGGGDATLALTTITFDVRTGHILDADIEVNAYEVELSTSQDFVSSDLQSILTHEIGHLLGLAHSLDEDATMNASYDRRDLAFRTLSEDDQRGICQSYPPGEDLDGCKGAQPRFGFSRYCAEPYEVGGCTLRPRAAQDSQSALLTMLALLILSRRRRSHHG